MGKTTFLQSVMDLYLLLGKANHSLSLMRQRELRHIQIPVRQTYILRIIKALGPKATLAEVAMQAERKVGVITKQAVCMEKDGLIKRIKKTPKSNLLSLELTDKGLEIAKGSRYSKSIAAIFSSLTKEEFQQLETILNKLVTELKHPPV